MDDVIPEAQRAPSIPWTPTCSSFSTASLTYSGTPRIPFWWTTVWPAARRVGALISCRKDYIQGLARDPGRIPPAAQRTKVPWRKRRLLLHLSKFIPITGTVPRETWRKTPSRGSTPGTLTPGCSPLERLDLGHMEKSAWQ